MSSAHSGYFVYSDDLSTEGGSVSPESVGPFVIEAGKAIQVRLTAAHPKIEALRADGTITGAGVHLGVWFNTITPKGELPERGVIFRVTELHYAGEERIGAKPRVGHHKGL